MTPVLPSQPPRADSSRSAFSLILCWLVILGFVAFTARSQAKRAQRAAVIAAASTTEPNTQLTLVSRASLGELQLVAKDNSPAGQANGERLRKQLGASIAELAVSPLDKLKAVVMTRELQGPDAALRELDAKASAIAPHPELVADAATLRMLYIEGPGSISNDARDQLIHRLDWFGELALTQGQPVTSPQRAIVLQTAEHTLLLVGGLGAGLLGTVFLGCLLLILLIVLFALGKAQWRFQPAMKFEKPVFLETFAIWCVVFLALPFALARWRTGRSMLTGELVMLAATLLVALWPLFRGVGFAQLRHSLGWHRGAGIFKEAGFGALGYLAGLPLIGLGFFITLILMKASHITPSHPIQQEMTGTMSPGKIISLLLAASVAAPILEETMFRGALYFHLRRRWRVSLSALLVAVIFAAIHPQGWTVVPTLASIAIVLAMLREWRGSLLASVTAHGINNAVVLLAGVLVLK